MRVWCCKKPWHPQPCWHGKCSGCGDGDTAFAFTEGDARAEVEWGCSCGKARITQMAFAEAVEPVEPRKHTPDTPR